MTWWTITKPTVGEATKKQAFADKAIDNLVHLYGLIGGVSAGASGGSLIPNGSFESDEDADGIPDGWSLTEYTAAAGAVETSDISHGRKAYKFTSPGATGGGYLVTTDFFPVSPGKTVIVDFLHKSSVAGIHNMVELLWYTAAEGAASPSATALYDSTDNPTSYTRICRAATPPSNARLAKLRITGAKNDNATAGIAYFDGVSVYTSPSVPTVVGFTTAAGAAGNITIGGTLSGYVTISETATGGGFGARSGVTGGATVSVVAGAATVDLVLPVGLWTIVAGAVQSYVGEGSVTTTVLAAMAIREM